MGFTERLRLLDTFGATKKAGDIVVRLNMSPSLKYYFLCDFITFVSITNKYLFCNWPSVCRVGVKENSDNRRQIFQQ